MKKIFKKIIKWTEGKKTIFGIAMHAGLMALTFFTDKVSFKDSLEYHAYISTITGVGLIHKAGRNEKVKKAFNKNKFISNTKNNTEPETPGSDKK